MLTIAKRHQCSVIRSCVRHMLRGDSLLTMVIEGKMEGKTTRERLRQMMLDWMMVVDGYGKLKEEANQQKEWQRHYHHTVDPPERQRTRRKDEF